MCFGWSVSVCLECVLDREFVLGRACVLVFSVLSVVAGGSVDTGMRVGVVWGVLWEGVCVAEGVCIGAGVCDYS